MESSGGGKGCMQQLAGFIRTHKGILLTTEIALCILILICYGASVTLGYVSLAIFELIYTTVIFILFAFEFHLQITFIHWGWTDFLRALIGSVAFLITSLIVVIGHRDGAGVAAGVFGLLVGIVMAYDAYTIVPQLRKQHSAVPNPEPSGGI
uniref:proteolipid protein 2 n=1 Tax=Euleptes europaea TaxID=460621 RepID=UPI0025425BBD|nr:proteolipid protein 2 [Euleptes europaea]